jgi:hypothetical protein
VGSLSQSNTKRSSTPPTTYHILMTIFLLRAPLEMRSGGNAEELIMDDAREKKGTSCPTAWGRSEAENLQRTSGPLPQMHPSIMHL